MGTDPTVTRLYIFAYVLALQAGWGKCNESWMAGYCLKSCGKC